MKPVNVISVDGKPLMPTTRNGHVRRMLKNKLAKVKKTDPFTIQLLYRTATEITQPIDSESDSKDAPGE